MGNEIFIQNKRMHVQPLKSQLEAIQKLQPPTTVKGCRNIEALGDGQFSKYVLPRIAEIIKAKIQFDHKR